MDRHNATMPPQQPKMPILEPYGNFGIRLRGFLHPCLSFIAQRIALFINICSTRTKGVFAKAVQNANSAQHSRCHSEQAFEQIDQLPQRDEPGAAALERNHRENISCGCCLTVGYTSQELDGHLALIAAASGHAQSRYASKN
jgi:hypothetical protein